MTASQLIVLLFAGAVATSGPDSPLAPPEAGRELVCRGYEDSGNITEDQPAWPCHLVNLFVTGKNPNSPIHTIQQHVRWVNDPAHSYVDDGTGGLVVWAHPGPKDVEPMAALEGLAGLEISCGGDSTFREAIWDRVLTLCHDRGREYLWGFAGDDSHSKRPEEIGRSFLVARLAEFSEPALKRALRTGAFYVSTGPLISDIQVRGGTVAVRLPAACEVRWLKSGQFGFGPAVVGPGPGENRCLKRDPETQESVYSPADVDGTTDPKSARFVRAVVIGRDGRVAQTMPFRIVAPGRLDNPYPPAGQWYRGQTHNHCDATGPKHTPAAEYRRAYQQAGHHWGFATDYGYWLTPFQRYPDVLVRVRGVSPDRGPTGSAGPVVIFGERFGPQAKVLIAGRPAPKTEWVYENRIRVELPADLSVGCHDVTVVDGGFKDTLPQAYTVQADGADNRGWTTWTTLNSRLPGDRAFCIAFPHPGSPVTTGQEAAGVTGEHQQSFAPGAGRVVWVGTEYGVGRFDGQEWKAITRWDNDFIGDAILSIAADHRGSTWFGSFRGLTQLAPDGSWRLFRTEQGLPSREVNRCFVDSRGNLWISYNGKTAQVSRFDGSAWQHFAPPNGTNERMSLAIAEDAAGRILVAPRKSGVGAFDGRDWRVWTVDNSGLPSNFVRHIRVGRDGALYFATTAEGDRPVGGLAILRDDRWTVHTESAGGLASYRVWDVCIDRAGAVWCATSHGVSRLSPDGRWKTFTTRNSGLAFDFVMGVAQGPDGAMWFATARGVSRYQISR